MTATSTTSSIASYEVYLTTYFPNHAFSQLSPADSPKEIGLQLALESLEKHSESMRIVSESEKPAEQGVPGYRRQSAPQPEP